VNDIEIMFLYYYNSINKYIKKLLGIPSYILKRLKLCLEATVNACTLREIK